MKTFVPGEEISVLENRRDSLAETGISVARVEHVKEVQSEYEKLPMGSYYFIPANFESEHSPATHIAKRTCIGISYEDGSGNGAYSNTSIWAEDPSISIHWNVGKMFERFHNPTIYTGLRHSVWIKRTKPFLDNGDLRKAILRDYKKWWDRVPKSKKSSIPYGSFFHFQTACHWWGHEPNSLTEIAGIGTGQELFEFIIRFLNGKEPQFLGTRQNWGFVREHKEQILALFGLETAEKRKKTDRKYYRY